MKQGGEAMPKADLLQLFPVDLRDALASELRKDTGRIEDSI